jgi:hypothetical protein
MPMPTQSAEDPERVGRAERDVRASGASGPVCIELGMRAQEPAGQMQVAAHIRHRQDAS